MVPAFAGMTSKVTGFRVPPAVKLRAVPE